MVNGLDGTYVYQQAGWAKGALSEDHTTPPSSPLPDRSGGRPLRVGGRCELYDVTAQTLTSRSHRTSTRKRNAHPPPPR